jgi:RNA polymerase sigma-70 factor, ECF subfamily
MSSSAAQVLLTATPDERRPVPRPYLAVCPVALPANNTLHVAAPSHSAADTESEMIAMLPALRRRAWRWCRDDVEAEDLAQETVLRGLGAGPSFASESHVRAWLYTVLRNLFISRRRREQSAQRALAELGAATLASSAAAPPASFLSQSVEHALAALPEQFARVVRLVDLEEHTYAEAAALLDVPVGTVMSRLFRGRKRLAQALGAPEV